MRMSIITKFILCLIGIYFKSIVLQGAFIYAQQQNETDLWVMSYNIRVAVDTGINSWDNRKEKVACMIRFHNADVIGLQEALKFQIEDLIRLIPEYSWTGVGRDDGKDKGEYSAILFKKGKFELLNSSTFWLSETPGSVSTGWDAALPRIATWALLKDKNTQKEFYHFNTHFDHIGVNARKNSAKLIIEKIKEITKSDSSLSGKTAVIVTGDFNSRPESDVYKIMSEKLPDAKIISKHGHYGSSVSFNGFGKSIEDGNRIDYIFVNDKAAVDQHGIIGDTFEGNYPSDHMPVLAEIVIQ